MPDNSVAIRRYVERGTWLSQLAHDFERKADETNDFNLQLLRRHYADRASRKVVHCARVIERLRRWHTGSAEATRAGVKYLTGFDDAKLDELGGF